MKIKVLFIFGTRPEAIKMAPLIKAFYNQREKFEVKTCVTAQHREMLDQVLDFFSIQPEYDLDIMEPNQNLNSITSKIITKLKVVLDEYDPKYVFVHGDTTTTMAATLASFYHGAKICHIEAGLRTDTIRNPFPEEANRRITSVLTDYHFAPTEQSKQNLIKENIAEEKIIVTGNTVIDALFQSVKNLKYFTSPEIKMLKDHIDNYYNTILITGHRRENHGEKFVNICNALKEIANNNPNTLLIYPVHLNPNVLKPVYAILSDIKNILLIKPLSYPNFVWLMNQSKIIITDSGGVQEEAPSIGKPVLVLRDTTERPEAVEAGTVILVGTDSNKIIKNTQELLDDSEKYFSMTKLHNPYGDGNSCNRIVDFIINKSF